MKALLPPLYSNKISSNETSVDKNNMCSKKCASPGYSSGSYQDPDSTFNAADEYDAYGS